MTPADIGLDHSLARLGSTANLDDRLNALRHLLIYWKGDWPPHSDPVSPTLPSSMQSWIAWGGASDELWVHNSFAPPEKMDRREDGLLPFHFECQGVYSWATEPSGVDPDVYGRFPEETSWTPEGRTLSEHLITAFLYERLCEAPFQAFTAYVDEPELAQIERHVALLPIAPWRWSMPHNAFHASAGVFAFIGRSRAGDGRGGNLHIAARSPELLAFLEPLNIDWDFDRLRRPS